ncbi:uncharacterized protein LOC143041040 [Oratosquilla oratoria]|uniref:uncharacterized protein LOC143041040 n=1 Tax=Oratosquilla oratoria TaxID=337810 RepID=UPI003F764AF9
MLLWTVHPRSVKNLEGDPRRPDGVSSLRHACVDTLRVSEEECHLYADMSTQGLWNSYCICRNDDHLPHQTPYLPPTSRTYQESLLKRPWNPLDERTSGQS